MELLKSWNHPDELLALIKFKLGGCETVKPATNSDEIRPQLKICYEFLNQTSRSFAAVIQALDGELRDAVCIFYLVLRALDTVEDDMTIPSDIKIPLLKSFYQKLQQPEWCYMDSQEKDKQVLQHFTVISGEFRKLEVMYQEVISDICKKMGEGMTLYLDKAPNTMQDWDQYCHFVAGLVGIGLSRLFAASGLEDKVVGEDTELANSMGLFLQKTNIIRDYLEDVLQERHFWPKEAWGKHAKCMIELTRPNKNEDAIRCLNELVTNALQHIPDCLKYMSRLKNKSVFNFCAIPQVMAIGTLERCYNNIDVFSGVVKIRKGEAVRMMMEARSMSAVKAIIKHFTSKILSKIPADDPSGDQTRSVCDQVLTLCDTDHAYVSSTKFYPLYLSCGMMVGAIVWQYWTNITTLYSNYLQQFQD